MTRETCHGSARSTRQDDKARDFEGLDGVLAAGRARNRAGMIVDRDAPPSSNLSLSVCPHRDRRVATGGLGERSHRSEGRVSVLSRLGHGGALLIRHDPAADRSRDGGAVSRVAIQPGRGHARRRSLGRRAGARQAPRARAAHDKHGARRRSAAELEGRQVQEAHARDAPALQHRLAQHATRQRVRRSSRTTT